MMPHPGIVGRHVRLSVTRGETVDVEVCEVVACQVYGEYGYFALLVAEEREGGPHR